MNQVTPMSERDLISQVVVDTVGTSTPITQATKASKHKKMVFGILLLGIAAGLAFAIYTVIKGRKPGPPPGPTTTFPPSPLTASPTATFTMIIPLPFINTVPTNAQLINAGEIWPYDGNSPAADPGTNAAHRLTMSHYQAIDNTVAPLGTILNLTGTLVDEALVNAFVAQPNTTDFVDLTSPFVLKINNPMPINDWFSLSRIIQIPSWDDDWVYPTRAFVAYRPQEPGFITLGDFVASINRDTTDGEPYQLVQNPVTLNPNFSQLGLVPKYMTVEVTSTAYYNLNCAYGYTAASGCYTSVYSDSYNFSQPLCNMVVGGLSQACNSCNIITCNAPCNFVQQDFSLTPQNVLNSILVQPNRFARAALNGLGNCTRAVPVGTELSVPLIIYKIPATTLSFIQVGKALNIDPMLLFHCNKLAVGFATWFATACVATLPAIYTDVDCVSATMPVGTQIWAPDIVSAMFASHPEWQYDESFYTIVNPFAPPV